jgi:ribose-phosphate pyrophosphokinase
LIIVHEKTNASLATRIAARLCCDAIELELPVFSNGEIDIKYSCGPFDRAIVIFSKTPDINRQIVEFMMMVHMCRHCKIIDAVVPYIPYSRQEKLDALPMKLLRSVITLDMHQPNGASRNIINVLPHEIFGSLFLEQKDLVIVAPDIGGRHRVSHFAAYLGTKDVVFIDKQTGRYENMDIVNGRNCLIVDDIVDSGKTIKCAAEMLKSHGAVDVDVCVSHGFFGNYQHSLEIRKMYISESYPSSKFATRLQMDWAMARNLLLI